MGTKKKRWAGLFLFLISLSAVITSFAAGPAAQPPEEAGQQGGLTLEVAYGYQNRAKGGRYVPLEVAVENQEEGRFTGTLQVLAMESDYEVYRYDYPLEIEGGERIKERLYIHMGNRSDQIFVTVADAKGVPVIHKRLKMDFRLEVPELFVGILSDTPEPLMAGWNGVGVDYGILRTRAIAFDAQSFPGDKLGLDMIDVMLISNFRVRDLSEEQSQVLVEWVRNGGAMILGTGMRVDDTLGRFAPELLEEMYEEPEIRRVDMGGSYAREAPGDAGLTIPCVDFALSGGNILMADESQTLLSSVTYRKGIIAVAAYDFLDIAQFCQQNPSYLDQLLTRVLGEKRINALAESVYSGNSGQYWPVCDMLNTGNVTRLPSMGLYTMEIVIYVFLAGVGMYVFLRQRDLTEYYRISVVGLSVVFTVIIWMMGSRTRFRDAFYTYARFLEVAGDTVNDTVYMNARAPYSRPYEARLAADYSVKPVTQNYYGTGSAREAPAFTGAEDDRIRIVRRKEEAIVSIRDVPAFEPRYFQLDRVSPNTESIGFEGRIEIDQGRYTGSVTNRFPEKLENCVVLLYGKLIYLGDMEPGETCLLDGREALGCPFGYSYQVASYLSGESRFEKVDIRDEAYVEAVEKTNLFSFYLDTFMPDYSPNARVVGVCSQDGGGNGQFLKAGEAQGKTMVSSDLGVYSSEEEVLYRSALIRTPTVLSGSYDPGSNTLYGADPVALEYALGNDVRLERLSFQYVSDVFVAGRNSGELSLFQGTIYFYNHSTGKYDLMDSMKLEYEAYELAPYLSPGNAITIKYVYEDMTDYNWNILLPMLNIVGREY